MDVSGEKESGSVDSIADPSSRDGCFSGSSGMKSCADCRTTKTPLWRCGPSGPKSLCNACGIRYRKKRRPVLGLKERGVGGERVGGGSAKGGMEEKRDRSKKKAESLKMTMMGFRRDIFWKLGSLIRKQNRRRLGEEEEAAILLMAISCGLVYA